MTQSGHRGRRIAALQTDPNPHFVGRKGRRGIKCTHAVHCSDYQQVAEAFAKDFMSAPHYVRIIIM
jgi:hypothetical protein